MRYAHPLLAKIKWPSSTIFNQKDLPRLKGTQQRSGPWKPGQGQGLGGDAKGWTSPCKQGPGGNTGCELRRLVSAAQARAGQRHRHLPWRLPGRLPALRPRLSARTHATPLHRRRELGLPQACTPLNTEALARPFPLPGPPPHPSPAPKPCRRCLPAPYPLCQHRGPRPPPESPQSPGWPPPLCRPIAPCPLPSAHSQPLPLPQAEPGLTAHPPALSR